MAIQGYSGQERILVYKVQRSKRIVSNNFKSLIKAIEQNKKDKDKTFRFLCMNIEMLIGFKKELNIYRSITERKIKNYRCR